MDFAFTGTGFKTMDSTSGEDNLSPYVNKPGLITLSSAKNVRFTANGGCSKRPGIYRLVDIGTSSKILSSFTLPEYNVAFFRSGTKIFCATKAQLEAGNAYDIGVTRTTGLCDHMYGNFRDVYATNGTDAYLRIAVAKATAAILDTDVTITVDDIAQFAASGTVYINGDAITYSGTSGSQLTGVSGIATGGHAINSIITQTSTPSGAPTGTCIGEIDNCFLVGDGSTLRCSLGQTDAEPELAYNFLLTDGATAKRLSGSVNAIKSGLSVALIGLSNGIEICTGLNDATGGLMTLNLSRVHGVPNAFCIVEMDKQFAILTNEGRILIAAQGQNAFEVFDDPKDKTKNFDYYISGYIKDNKDPDNSENRLFYNPNTKILKATIKMRGGKEDIICQTDIGAWSVDTSKNVQCRTLLEDFEIAGDDANDLILRDEYGWDDNGAPIIGEAETGRLRLGRAGITGDFLSITTGGVLSGNGEFKQALSFSGSVVEETVTAEDMIEKGQMSIPLDDTLGDEDLGTETLGTGDFTTDVYEFTRQTELSHEANYVRIKWSFVDDGVAGEIRFFDLRGEHNGTLLSNPS